MILRLGIASCHAHLFHDAASRFETLASSPVPILAWSNGPGEKLARAHATILGGAENVGVLRALHGIYEEARRLDAAVGAADSVIGYVHDDLRVTEEGWDRRVLAEFEARPNAVLVGFAGGSQLGRKAPVFRLADALYRGVFQSNLLHAERYGSRRKEPFSAAVVDGLALFVRRSFLDQIGGFAWWPFFHHGYDYALSAQAIRHGKEIRVVPVACDHLEYKTSSTAAYRDKVADEGGDQGLLHRAIREVTTRFAREIGTVRSAEPAPGDAPRAPDLPLPPRSGGDLEGVYRALCITASDINEHLPTLRSLAASSRHVTEMGTRWGTSMVALLSGRPKKLVCYDVAFQAQAFGYAALRPVETDLRFRQEDVLRADVEETDLLFIDTLHTFKQLSTELARHAPKARKWIVLHDTTTFGARGEDGTEPGLWRAVEDFLARGTFRLHHRYENNNGLTVLERVSTR